jgi:hypothetical protein
VTGQAISTSTTTPEPASFTLLGGALALFLFARRRVASSGTLHAWRVRRSPKPTIA